MDDVRAAVRTRAVKLRCLFVGTQPECPLPLFLLVEVISVGIGVRGLVAHQPHEPFRRFAFHFQHHPALEFAQPVVRQEKRNEDRRDADGHKPFVADVTRRMEGQALLRKLLIELLDERLKLGALQFQPEPGDFLFQQFLVAEIDPIGRVHAGT